MELIERLEHANVYSLGPNRREMVIGGGVSNCHAFDSGRRVYVDETYRLSDATEIQDGVWKLGTGRYGYIVDLNRSIIRIYPVWGDWTKYIEIYRLIPQPMEARNLHDKAIECYVDTPTFRWSFFITDRGFKVNIRLKQGYSGSGTVKMGIRLNGLTKQGATVYDGNKAVVHFKKPWLEDSSEDPINRDVDEDITSGVLTLTADISGLTFPINIDPTLGPVQPLDKDSYMYQFAPTTNYGSEAMLQTRYFATGNRRQTALLGYDFSAAIPAGSVIDSAVMELYCYAWVAGSYSGLQEDCYRGTENDWVESEVTWNNRKAGTPWAAGGGDYTLTDSDTFTHPGAAGYWADWSIKAQIQTALDTQAGVYTGFIYDLAPSDNKLKQYYSKEEAVQTTLRPKITMTYTLPEPGLMGGGFGSDEILMGNTAINRR